MPRSNSGRRIVVSPCYLETFQHTCKEAQGTAPHLATKTKGRTEATTDAAVTLLYPNVSQIFSTKWTSGNSFLFVRRR